MVMPLRGGDLLAAEGGSAPFPRVPLHPGRQERHRAAGGAAVAAAGAERNAGVQSSVFGMISLYFSFYEAKKDVCWRR